MVPVKVEDRYGPRHKAITQLADAVQAGGPRNPPQPGLRVSGEVGQLGPEIPAADVDGHMSLVSFTLTLSECLFINV